MLMLPDTFVFAAGPAGAEHGPGWWFGFAGGRLLVQDADDHVPHGAHAPWGEAGDTLLLGFLDGRPCRARALPEDFVPPPGLHLEGLRALWGRLPEALLGIAGQAAQVLAWDADHRWCGRCGTPTERRADERSRQCPSCGHSHYPRVSPAIMVRVERGDEILLARSPRFLPGVYSVLAGFVDAGEALEQTVVREVREEVGLELRDLRYVTSQSWPFPHSLMIAFTAQWAGGDIAIDGEEIVAADWFRRDALPGLPSPMSIARHLIDDWLRRGA